MKKIQSWSKIIYSCIYLFIAIFFVYGLTLTNSARELVSMLMSLEKQGYVLLFIWGYVCLFLLLFKMRKNLANFKRNDFLLFLIILASCPRIFVMCQNHYIPSNDFKWYYDVGVHLVEGDKAFVYEFLARYNITKFGGLAVFMGIIAKLFSVKLIGFQIANIIITTFICVFIYLITENYNKKAAIIASILFAIYPENIISSQVTTNHHGAVLFALIGIFALIKAEKGYRNRRTCYIICIVSGVALAISDFIHPSIIVPIIAVFCWGILDNKIQGEGIKKLADLKFTKCILAILVYAITMILCFNMLKAGGIIGNDANTSQTLPLGKVVVGLNHETRGMWSQEDSTATSDLTAEDKREWQKEQIKERVFDRPIKDFLSLMRDKADIVWFKQGSYFSWYWSEWYQELCNKNEAGVLSEDLAKEWEIFSVYSSYQLFDQIFLRIIYIFAILGLIMITMNRKRNAGIELAAWVLLGWILSHLLIEVQERYRYLGMPYIFIFAAIGVYECYRRLKLICRCYLVK